MGPTVLANRPPITERNYGQQCGHKTILADEKYPEFDQKYLVENTVTYPVAINGKTRFTIELDANADKKQVEEAAVNHEKAKKYSWKGKQIRKVIVVPKRMVNIVVG